MSNWETDHNNRAGQQLKKYIGVVQGSFFGPKFPYGKIIDIFNLTKQHYYSHDDGFSMHKLIVKFREDTQFKISFSIM